MDDPYAVDRRGFLKTGAVAAAATAVGLRDADQPLAGAHARRRRRRSPPPATRSSRPTRTPARPQAGVVTFVDRQLATRQKKDARPRWQAGLRGLDATARRRHGKPFAELPFEAQTAVLQDVEKGAVEAADWSDVEPAAFFALLREHTMMGFYGDPRHGGNKDRVSWRMLGVPDPPIRGRLHETPRRARPRPPRKG